MAPAQIAAPPLLPQPVAQSPIQHDRPDTGRAESAPIQTVDALVRRCARTNPHATIVSYPTSGVDFVDYSMQQLDVFAYRVTRHYQAFIPTRSSSSIKPTIVAILGPSNFDYIITILALTKLGHTVQFLSTRISQLAVESLIDTTGATHLLADPRYLPLGAQVQTSVPSLRISSVAGSDIYDFPIKVHADTRMDHQLDSEVEASNIVYIIHSSGEQTTILLWLYELLNFNRIDWATKADLSATEEHNRELCYSMD